MPEKKYKVTKNLAPFTTHVKRLTGRVKRLDEFLKGAEEILSRKPNSGKSTKNPYIFALKMKELSGNPRITLFYSYSTTEVYFLMLKSGDNKTDEITL
jgi:hypothetical protein